MSPKIALMLVLIATLSVASARSAQALQSPTLEAGITAEGSWDHLEGALAWGPQPWLYLVGARFDRLAYDVRLYGGVRLRLLDGPLYALHIDAAGGPRAAFRDEAGLGAWGLVRGRGVWTWERWALHAGLFVDAAAELVGVPDSRVRPGGDLGVGRAFGGWRLWLNLDAGYSLGGEGAGGLELGGAAGVQW